MNLRYKKLIIFDFDGTLINSIPDLTLAINKMLSHYQLPILTIEEVTPFVGNGAELLVKRALLYTMKNEEHVNKMPKEAFKVYFNAYESITCQQTHMYVGVLETLEYLQNKGYKMAICTNKPFRFIEPILDKLSIKGYFSYWVGEDSLPEKKPKALPLIHIANNLNISIKESIMVGDSKNDILAAQNAEMDSIGVSYGYNYNEHISNYNPTIIVDNFSELQKIF